MQESHDETAQWFGRVPDTEPLVIPGYTADVKTAISIPDDTFERASARADNLGISRSEFFTRAAKRYLDELDAASLTSQIDAALDVLDDAQESAADAVAAGHRTLAAEDEW